MNEKQSRPPHFCSATFDVIALAASAGGLTALSRVLAALPANFPAAIVVVQHLDPRHRSLMADILSRRTSPQVKQAEEEDRLCPATVYIAPPNRHLLVNLDSTLRYLCLARLQCPMRLLLPGLSVAGRD